jgi:chaperone required for assembly of F1-ATPase
MSIDVNRRFYREAAVIPNGNTWRIALDGKVVKTPARNPLILPMRGLAEAIAAEWAAQDTKVKPDTMPLMQLASTAIDRVAPDRDRIIAEAAGYAATDLISYRAEAPAELVARQAAAWDPLIDWLRERYDVRLQVAAGVMAIPQSAQALAALTRAVAAQDDLRLTAVTVMTGAAGSLAVALAVLEGRISPEAGAEAAQLDELFQAERWGIDPEAEKRRAVQKADIVAARRFLDLLATGTA